MWRGPEKQTFGQFCSDLSWALTDNLFPDEKKLPNVPKKKRRVGISNENQVFMMTNSLHRGMGIQARINLATIAISMVWRITK